MQQPDRHSTSPGFDFFHLDGTRSERVRWILRELQIEHNLISEEGPSRSAKLKAAHPLVKVPAITGANWLADGSPERQIGWQPGTRERALHDQWTAFTLAELEANLWHTARNKFLYPEHLKVPQVYEQNARESQRALAVFDDHFRDREWLVGNRFSVTDIFCGFAIWWASMDGLSAGHDGVERYLARLLARPNCTYRNTR
jgi:glutathione S-transferase